MSLTVSRKLKNTNQRMNALEKRIADLEKMLKQALKPPPLQPARPLTLREEFEQYIPRFIPIDEKSNARKDND